MRPDAPRLAAGWLPATPPFDFGQSLRFLGGFTPGAGEQHLGAQALTEAVSVLGRPVVFRAHAAGTPAAPALAYELWAEAPADQAAALEQAAADRLRFYLSLDDDLRPFYALAETDPAFAPVVQKLSGYHQVKFPTPFENAVWAVLSQRNPLPQARRMKRALTEFYGRPLRVADETWWAFPEPSQMAGATPQDLDAVIGHKQKAGYLAGVAAAFNERPEAWLRAAAYDEVKEWLLGIKGLGAWSAAFILLRGLGRMERLPVDEKRLGESAGRVYGAGRPLAQKDLAALAERYGPYRGYWAHYLRAAG